MVFTEEHHVYNVVEGLLDSYRHDCLIEVILKATEFTQNQAEMTENKS